MHLTNAAFQGGGHTGLSMFKIPNHCTHLEFGIWNLFVIWFLVFGFWL
jgi:hypothetical protein